MRVGCAQSKLASPVAHGSRLFVCGDWASLGRSQPGWEKLSYADGGLISTVACWQQLCVTEGDMMRVVRNVAGFR
jgi:hypothetical protein